MEYVVDVGSFHIDEKTYNKIQSMDFQDQRQWLSKKVIDGYCDIDRIIEDVKDL
tara:strand:- start:9751 stop:9912 length:162 start_codon:yes stop_codon:yes gene_type:complete